ncbi:MAG: hypothetical protein H6594_06595 [Flavobacteriales bacterium]|nr:hypothetical protein [Flavobacteriales bacterium]
MRYPFLLGALLAPSILLFAQAPEAFQYQAVARDAGGDALTNTTVGVQFQLHQGTAGGTVVYAESHAPTTNANGLFSVEVGNGTPSTGTFSAIDWSAGPYFLEVGLDPAGGTSYTSVGTQQLLSVPYALHAKTADAVAGAQWADSGADIHNTNSGNVGIGEPFPQSRLHVSGDLRLNNKDPNVNTNITIDNATNGKEHYLFSDASTGELGLESEEGFKINTGGANTRLYIDTLGHVGIGTSAPDTTLHVVGKMKYQDGTQADKKILTSDADGNASWRNLDATGIFGVDNVPTPDLSCAGEVGSTSVGNAGSVSVSGHHAYVTSQSQDDLRVIDVSNPASPTEVAAISMGANPFWVRASNDRACVINYDDSELRVIDISTPASPALLATITTGSHPYSLAVDGGSHRVYIVDRSSNDLRVYNTYNPSNGDAPIATVSTGNDPRSISLANGHAYVVNYGDHTMSVFDLYNLGASPVTVPTTGSNPRFVTTSGGYAYVITAADNTLRIFDIGTGGTPTALGTIALGTDIRSVAVEGDHAFVVSAGDGNISVVDISDPNNPTLATTTGTADSPFDIDVADNYAYVANYSGDALTVHRLFCTSALTLDPNTGAFDPQVLDWERYGDDLVNTNAGNVGIGTASPTEALQIERDGDVSLKLRSTSGSGQTPGIKLVRGEETTDGYADWSIRNSGGQLLVNSLFNGVDHSVLLMDPNGLLSSVELHVAQYTKLGSDAPSIKQKVLYGTTATYPASVATISTGSIPTEKILAVDIHVEHAGQWYPPNAIVTGGASDADYQFSYRIGSMGSYFILVLTPTATQLSNSPIKILVTYEE